MGALFPDRLVRINRQYTLGAAIRPEENQAAGCHLRGFLRMVFFAPDPGTVKVGSVVIGLPEDNLFYSVGDRRSLNLVILSWVYLPRTSQRSGHFFTTRKTGQMANI